MPRCRAAKKPRSRSGSREPPPPPPPSRPSESGFQDIVLIDHPSVGRSTRPDVEKRDKIIRRKRGGTTDARGQMRSGTGKKINKFREPSSSGETDGLAVNINSGPRARSRVKPKWANTRVGNPIARRDYFVNAPDTLSSISAGLCDAGDTIR